MSTEIQTGFCWLLQGILGGIPLPESQNHLNSLNAMGIRHLISLTENWRLSENTASSLNFDVLSVPIPDLNPPTMAQAVDTCALVSRYIKMGEPVAFHCRAGKGRTGTMLAALLIYQGKSAQTALTQVRAANPQWVETQSQVDFLYEFSDEMQR